MRNRILVLSCAVLLCTGMVYAKQLPTPFARMGPMNNTANVQADQGTMAKAPAAMKAMVFHTSTPGTRQGGDTCGDATAIAALPYNDAGTTVGYFNDAGISCAGSTGGDVFYSYAPAADESITVSLCNGSDYDTALSVINGCPGSEVACNDDYCGLQSQVTVNVYAGNTYYICVGGFSSNEGNYVLDVTSNGPPPPAPDNDLCENATVVNTYPITLDGSTIGATADCPGSLNWNGVWYKLTLPYAANNVHIQYCGTETGIGTIGIVWMPDCSCATYTILTYTWNFCSFGGGYGNDQVILGVPGPVDIYIPAYVVDSAGAGMNFQVTFDVLEDLPGACCFPNGSCQVLTEGTCAPQGGVFQGANTTCEPNNCPPPCVECPAGGIPENEPACYTDYVDVTNGGCNSSPPVFGTVAVGQTICGETGTYLFGGGNYRDTDWFQIDITSPTLITMTVNATFPVIFGPIGQYTPGVPGCENMTGYIDPYLTEPACVPGTLMLTCWNPGTYYFFVGATVYSGIACGSPYTMLIEGVACDYGACCRNWNEQCQDNIYYADCAGPQDTFFGGLTCDMVICPSPPPANDLCENAEVISGPYPQTVLGTNQGATLDCTSLLNWPAVWYKVTLPYAVNNLYIQLCGTEEAIATVGVVIMPDCSCTSYTISTYAWNFCSAGGGYGIDQQWMGLAGPVDVYFPAYLVGATSGGGMAFQATFNVTESVPQPGDTCDTALPLGPLPNTLTGNTCAAINNYDAVCPYSGSSSPDLVYSYAPATDQQVTLDLCASGYDTKVYVYQDACDPGTEIACNDDFCPGFRSYLECVPMLAGHTYFVVVDGYGGACGDYSMSATVCEASGACCVGTDCSVVGESVCAGMGGNFLGGGTDCGLGGYAAESCSNAFEGAANAVTPLSDDGGVLEPIGFTFTFFGNSYTDVYVGMNGYLEFGTFYGDWSPDPIPSTNTPNNIIAPFWRDLYPPGAGNVTFETKGTAPNRTFVVAWNGVPYCCSSNPPFSTFEAVLFEGSNNIEFRYGDIPTGAGNVSGIENADGTVGLDVTGMVAAFSCIHIELAGGNNPCQPSFTRGDLNCDGLVNPFDIDPFILALTNPAAYHIAFPNCDINAGDINCDGLVNPFDIDGFIFCLTNPGGCAPCP